MDAPIFEQIATSLTVKTICGPLSPAVRAEDTVFEVVEHLDPGSNQDDPNFDPHNNPSRVIDADGNVIGILWFDNYFEIEDVHVTVDQVMERIEPHEFLSSATGILDAVELFGRKDNHHFYIIDGNDIVGLLRYRDLFRPIGRLAFLALALEIEDQALRLCQSWVFREQCWLSLSENRRSKAIDVFKSRYGREPYLEEPTLFSDVGQLIACTHLIDKAHMIWKRKLIAPATRSDVLGVFHSLKELRDECAHPGGKMTLVPKERLANFISSAKSLRTSLQQAMALHGVGTRTELCWPPD